MHACACVCVTVRCMHAYVLYGSLDNYQEGNEKAVSVREADV